MVGRDSPARPPISTTGAAEPVGWLLSVASVHDEVMKNRHIREQRDGGVWAQVRSLRRRAPVPTVAPLPRDPETDVSGDDVSVTGKIALAHLTEFLDCYTRFAILAREAEDHLRAQK
jgi:hypothetical protein